MLQSSRVISSSSVLLRHRCRKFSTEQPKVAAATIPTIQAASNGGSTLVQRLSSFFIGTAVGFGANFFLVHEELLESNKRFEKTLQDIQKQLKNKADK